MSAGLLTYRLCDRDYDCEHCPLDAALRGDSLASWTVDSPPAAWTDRFPGDRSYTEEHLWVQGCAEEPNATVRVGLNAFAVAMIGTPRAFSLPQDGAKIGRRAKLIEIDLGCGALAIGSPLAGTVASSNETLRDDAGLIATETYGNGWLVELNASEPPEAEWLDADAVRELAQNDLRWFRRRVACHLFADATAVGPSLPDGGQILTDLRQILGGDRYFHLLNELFR